MPKKTDYIVRRRLPVLSRSFILRKLKMEATEVTSRNRQASGDPGPKRCSSICPERDNDSLIVSPMRLIKQKSPEVHFVFRDGGAAVMLEHVRFTNRSSTRLMLDAKITDFFGPTATDVIQIIRRGHRTKRKCTQLLRRRE